MPRPILAAAFAVLAFMPAVEAQAHAHLVSATPADRAVVASPTHIILRFNEKLEPKFSGFEVTDARNAPVAIKTTMASDGLTLSGAPATALPPGPYKVKWRAVGRDGHRLAGSHSFTVR